MENGNNYDGDPYLKISNDLLGAIITSKNLLTNEGKVFMVIFFKTIGFKKDKDWLTYKQICKFTGINLKQNICRAVKKLTEQGLIIKEGKFFKVNQEFNNWQNIDKKVIKSDYFNNKKVIKSDYQSNQIGLPKLSNMITPSTDNIITDKTNTDNICYRVDNKNSNHKEQIEEIIKYLNQKADKNFRANTKKTIEKIRSRLNEGYIIEDFKKVIDIKVNKWKNTEFDDYLRPETLFGPKFENYLNERPIKSKKHFEFEKTYSDDEQALIIKNFYGE